MVWDAWDLAGRFGYHAFSYSLPKKLAASGVDFSWGCSLSKPWLQAAQAPWNGSLADQLECTVMYP